MVSNNPNATLVKNMGSGQYLLKLDSGGMVTVSYNDLNFVPLVFTDTRELLKPVRVRYSTFDNMASGQEVEETYVEVCEPGFESKAMVHSYWAEGKHQEPVKKVPYLVLTLLTGWFGGHKFYVKETKKGVLYLIFFWTCIPFLLSLVEIAGILTGKKKLPTRMVYGKYKYTNYGGTGW